MKSKLLLLLSYRIVYIALSLVICILIIENLWYAILLPAYMVYIKKNHENLILVIIVILGLFLTNFNIKSVKTIEDSTQYKVEVLKVNQENTYTMIVCKIDGVMVNGYFSDKITVIPGDVYTVKGELKKPLHNTFPNGFDYNEYLLSKGIYYQLFIDSYSYNSHHFNLNIINYNINKYIDAKIPLSKSYIKTFILADKSDFDQQTIIAINRIGISHLFAVSGLHVGLLVLIIKKLLSYLNLQENISNLLITIILLIYIIITAYSPSVVRAGLMFILIVLNKKFKYGFSNIDILSMIFIGLLIFNPYYYNNLGFVLSFLVTFLLLLSSSILKEYTGIKQLFMVSFISFMGTLPIIISMNNQINLLTLIFNILFITYMSYIILPLSYLTFIFPFLDRLLYNLITSYNQFIVFCSKIELFIFKGSFEYIWEYMIYYIIILYFFKNIHIRPKNFKSFIYVIIIVVVSLNTNYLSPEKSVIFLDVKGDSTFISDSYNNCNIMIDTGESDDYDSVINYLLSKNIRRLDYLFISHFHSDHYGEMYDISNSLDVRKTITPDNVEQYYNKQIECGSITILVYELSSGNPNENNNSIVMSVFVNNKHYFFTGDSELEREIEFIENYNINVDYLKVPHHGSSTSSSYEFIDSLNPSEAFIMVYRYNIFDHPDVFVINRYNNRGIPVYRTDLMGSIEVKYLFGIERKKYYMP